MSYSLRNALEMTTATDPGLVRGHNEDALLALADTGLLVLADGMGGYNAGEVASNIAISLISEGVKASIEIVAPHVPEEMSGKSAAHRILRREIENANLAIFQTAQSQSQCAGMGTTLVTALFYDNRVTLAHVGDSRAYRLREQVLTQLTRDHSLLQEQIDSGLITLDQAKHSHNKNLVTRAVGVDPQLEPELSDHDCLPGDLYLLCSDGLTDLVDDEDICVILNTLHSNLAMAASQLVQIANDNGGRDNISVGLVRIRHAFPAAQGLWHRMFGWLGR